MGELGELLPVLGGAVVGGVALRMPRSRLRTLFLVVGCVVAGALASYANGELEISLGFVLVDVPLALLGAFVVLHVGARVLAPVRHDPGP